MARELDTLEFDLNNVEEEGETDLAEAGTEEQPHQAKQQRQQQPLSPVREHDDEVLVVAAVDLKEEDAKPKRWWQPDSKAEHQRDKNAPVGPETKHWWQRQPGYGQSSKEVTRLGRWSALGMDPGDCRLACCCPCVAVGMIWRNVGLGSFLDGCLPVGLVYVLVILFSVLPYAVGGGPCTFPSAQTETVGFLKVFTGKCTTAEAIFLVLARICWCCFALALLRSRRRLARRLGISEGPCPTLCGYLCCCHACLLGTEMQTAREAAGLDRSGARARAKQQEGAAAPSEPMVGAAVRALDI
mmetsp:Transcript_116067/g.248229  ORF Transcript_116067/g.248229 Transcript_116067/m.248229 type:complete len:299 (-) Transcript_116067:3-899(-)